MTAFIWVTTVLYLNATELDPMDVHSRTHLPPPERCDLEHQTSLTFHPLPEFYVSFIRLGLS